MNHRDWATHHASDRSQYHKGSATSVLSNSKFKSKHSYSVLVKYRDISRLNVVHITNIAGQSLARPPSFYVIFIFTFHITKRSIFRVTNQMQMNEISAATFGIPHNF